ncbi:MAG TPA: cytochrome P450 [Pseudonocardiaceae bacterium]
MTTDVLAALAEPEIRRDPYPLLARLREQDPVHRTSKGFYLLTRHADVKWTFEQTGTVFLGPDRAQLAAQYPEAERHRAQQLFLNSIAMQNPPDHGRLRAPMVRAIHAASSSGLAARVETRCEELLDAISEPLRDGAVVDLHERLSLPLSTRVFADLLGVPDVDAPRLAGLITDIYPATMPLANGRAQSYDEVFAKADSAAEELCDHLVDLFDQRRDQPCDDIVSALVAQHDRNSAELSDDELIAMVWLLWVAGVETAAAGIDHGLRAAMIHRDHLRLDDGAAFGGEALRLYGSSLFAGVVRVATEDVRFGDVTIPVGSDVRPSTAAANRDPAVFADPDRFDPSRSQQESMSFGGGMRDCFAAPVARTELSVTLRRTRARFPELVAAGEPVWHQGVATRLMRTLPARLP